MNGLISRRKRTPELLQPDPAPALTITAKPPRLGATAKMADLRPTAEMPRRGEVKLTNATLTRPEGVFRLMGEGEWLAV